MAKECVRIMAEELPDMDRPLHNLTQAVYATLGGGPCQGAPPPLYPSVLALRDTLYTVSYTHLRAHETEADL
eukprot:1946324-Rhodomonas_salina.2